MADRANPADARHERGHLVERTAFDKLLKAAKLSDMKLSIFYLAQIIEVDGDFAVTFDARHGMID